MAQQVRTEYEQRARELWGGLVEQTPPGVLAEITAWRNMVFQIPQLVFDFGERFRRPRAFG
ncbi:hypothetical protein [Segniliparus rotundus]|uniref:hypothetical protein n=1 Tax=Segniliparus rotundus TaxID=286802 RepID=UPI0002D5B192|nr:hypothetical protein [Segniliparus rotundus]